MQIYSCLMRNPSDTVDEHVLLAIVLLGIVRERPMLGGIDGAINFLNGYSYATSAFIPFAKRDNYNFYWGDDARGWKENANGPVLQMQERGWSDEAIIDGLFCIEIDALSRMLDDIKNSTAT